MAAPNPLPATTPATDHTRCFARLVAVESEIADTAEPAARAELRHRAARHLDAHLHGRVGPHTGGGPTVTRRLAELVATAAGIVAGDLRGQYEPRVNAVTVATDRLRAEYEQHGDRFEIAWHLTWPGTSTGAVAVMVVGAALDGYRAEDIGRLHDGMGDTDLRDVVCHLAEMGALLIGKRAT